MQSEKGLMCCKKTLNIVHRPEQQTETEQQEILFNHLSTSQVFLYSCFYFILFKNCMIHYWEN